MFHVEQPEHLNKCPRLSNAVHLETRVASEEHGSQATRLTTTTHSRIVVVYLF